MANGPGASRCVGRMKLGGRALASLCEEAQSLV